MLAAAWCGAALFFVSLSWFAYFYLVQLGRPVESSTAAGSGAAVFNIALFTAFAVHHSVFARAGAKAWIRRIVPAPLERTAYVVIASLLFLAVCGLWQPLPGHAWDATGIARWWLFGIQLVGVGLTLQSASRIDIWDLAGVRQARAAAMSVDPDARKESAPGPLEVTGPYRWVRHPIYLGWVLFVFGSPAMTSSRLLFAATSTAYLVAAIPIEERSLAAEFGKAYADYRRLVRWRLVPGLW